MVLSALFLLAKAIASYFAFSSASFTNLYYSSKIFLCSASKSAIFFSYKRFSFSILYFLAISISR